MSRSRKLKEIKMKTEWCKGCAICVEVCPKSVYEIKRFKSVVVHPEACIVCGRCEEACPDFCIEIIPDELNQ